VNRAGVFLILVACGGNVEPSTDGGGTDATNNKDGTIGFDVASDVDTNDSGVADAPPKGTCPTSAPTAGTSCASDGVGLECEYGTSWYVHCDAVFVCGDAGTWTGGTIATCPNAGNCPSDPSAAESCTPVVGPCDYSDRHCECATQCGGPCCGSGYNWACFIPSKTGCPFPRPNIGTACSNEGKSCQYGTCCTGSLLTCTGGLWREDVCPVPP
jgi:hypothetical protein